MKGKFKKMQMSLKLKLIITAMVVLTSSCGGSRENDPVEPTQASLQKSLQQVVDERIVPAAVNFKSAADSYMESADTFCALQDESALQQLQQQWRQLNEQWYRLIPYNFGPLKNDVVFPNYMFIDGYRLRGTNYSATVQEEIARVLAQTEALPEHYFENLSFQKGGLLALEILSFVAADGVQSDQEILFSYFMSSKRCELLIGHAQQMQARAESLVQGWLTDFNSGGTSYRQLFLNDKLPDDTPSLTQLLTAVQEYLDYLKQRNVVTTVAKFSNYSWPLVAASLQEIHTLLHGNGKDQFNFVAVMRSSGHEQEAATVTENTAFILASIEQKNASEFAVGVSLLDGNFKREIPNGLDVDLGITFTDGD